MSGLAALVAQLESRLRDVTAQSEAASTAAELAASTAAQAQAAVGEQVQRVVGCVVWCVRVGCRVWWVLGGAAVFVGGDRSTGVSGRARAGC